MANAKAVRWGLSIRPIVHLHCGKSALVSIRCCSRAVHEVQRVAQLCRQRPQCSVDSERAEEDQTNRSEIAKTIDGIFLLVSEK